MIGASPPADRTRSITHRTPDRLGPSDDEEGLARTHYLPDSERVHYTWDTGNEPVLGIDLEVSAIVDAGQ